MKWVSVEYEGAMACGVLDGEDVLLLGPGTGMRDVIADGLLDSPPLGSMRRIGQGEVALRPPVPDPGKIFCVGLNYDAHRIETGRDPTEKPTIFTRFADTLVGHGEAAWRPHASTKMDFEGELAVIIGRGGRHIREAGALDHVAGYSCFNDFSIRDFQRHTSQFTPGKNFPRTGGFGPWLVTAATVPDPGALELRTRVNGEQMQAAPTSQMLFPVPVLIAYLSSFTPLAPGDVIATGTPAGVGVKRKPPLYLKAGDRVEVEIDGIGTLENPVEDEPAY